ncbi:MAG: peptidyl-prolyl cis-trans isomerase [Planctomycetes bacterium]|nr:peptidyl-prolyl cis-trans isomerase [Planctomycetota bacterium]
MRGNPEVTPEPKGPVVVVMKTNRGEVEIELDPEKAPRTVANFLHYVDDKFYDGTIFHRVIPTFMIQGGGFTCDLKDKKTRGPIKNEADNGLKNERGTIAMARTPEVDSATAEFFVNVVDSAFLNHEDETPKGYGYCVFGRVTKGMDVVDTIRNTKTRFVRKGVFENVPVEPVIIESVRRKKEKEKD